MSTQVIRVMCADDNPLLAAALERHFTSEPRFAWVGWVGKNEELLTRVAQASPNILLLDIDMPGRNSFAAIGEVASISPGTRVVMFSGHLQRELIDSAIEAGAWGYISKHDGIDEVLRAIHEVMEGRFGLSREASREQRGRC